MFFLCKYEIILWKWGSIFFKAYTCRLTYFEVADVISEAPKTWMVANLVESNTIPMDN